MEAPKIEHSSNEYRGIFVMKDDGKTIASLTYGLEDGTMTIDHTEVNEAFEGNGLGGKLVEASYEYARDNDLKVNPLCPFTEVVFDNHPEWSHVRV